MRQGRDAVLVRIGRIIQRLPLWWLRVIEAPFVMAWPVKNRKPKLIMLLALPRSGSTLTYQLVIHSLKIPYLSNLANLLYQIPLFGGLVSAIICRDYQSNFSSVYGYISGVCGPAEGFRFWNYWMGFELDERNTNLTKEAISSRRSRYLRRVLSILSRSDSPIVSGYLGHALDPARLQEEFSAAVFIHLRRDPLSTALSILRGRREGDHEWLSVFPHQCEKVLGRGEYAEVAAQVYWLNRRLDDALSGENVYVMDYESLCEDPNGQMQRFEAFCRERGMDVSIKAKAPGKFGYKLAGEGESKDAMELTLELGKLEAAFGALAWRKTNA